jgi:hypothetical protein
MKNNCVELYSEINFLTKKIEENWKKFNYSSDDFYKVVWELTENLDLSLLGEVNRQLDLLQEPAVTFQQHRSTFSDFHFQIFHNGRFLIEILNWWGSHVNVHDHDFSGVQFQLKGNALNVIYNFLPADEAEHGAIRFGDLTVRQAEIWKEGGRSIVRPGKLDPHSVLHLGSPTTSLLIRTAPTDRYGAQSNYFPTLAAHYYVHNEAQRKKCTGLSLLARNSPLDFERHLSQFTATQSLSENFFMFLKLGHILFTEPFTHLVLNYARQGDLEAKIIQSVAFNQAIDFFKTQGNRLGPNSEQEKLALFSVAASHGLKHYQKIESDLDAAGVDIELNKNLDSFLSKLSQTDRHAARQYLDLFGLRSVQF